MKKFLFLLVTSLACLTPAVFVACDKEDKEKDFDVKGDTSSKIFFNERSGNDLTYSLWLSPVGPLGKLKAAWPTRRTSNEKIECKVTAEMDNSLIDSYNAKNKTVYKAFPNGTLTFVNMVTLGSGQSISADSIKISLDESKIELLTDSLYLTAVKIMSVSSGTISSNLHTVYVRLSLFRLKTNCYVNPKKEDMKGSPIADRTRWTASTTLSGNIRGELNSMFDGNKDTGWSCQKPGGLEFPFEVTVDMKTKVDHIEGIRINSPYQNLMGYSFAGPTKAEVFSGDNGTAWTSQGTAEMATGRSDSFAVYIRFYKNISAQYIKLKISATAYKSAIHIAEWEPFVTK